jgi:hypothetical protein
VTSTERGYCSLGDCNVLLNGAGARSDSPDDAPVEHDGYAATEDDNFAGITFLNTEQWLTRLRQTCEIRGRFIEDSGRHRLIKRKVDAADEAPSWRMKANRWPPASTTAIL